MKYYIIGFILLVIILGGVYVALDDGHSQTNVTKPSSPSGDEGIRNLKIN